MLTISENAHLALTEKARREWLGHAIRTVRGRHPQWSAQQTEDSLAALCLRLEDLSAEFDLNKQESFELLVDLAVEAGWSTELTGFQRYLLGRGGFTEEIAISLLCADVRRGSVLRLLQAEDLGFTLPPQELST